MALHARVEPDMQRHDDTCGPQMKIFNLTKIFDFFGTTLPDPPAPTRLFLPINRQNVEREGYPCRHHLSATNCGGGKLASAESCRKLWIVGRTRDGIRVGCH